LQETTVICGCHGSQFDITSGAVLQGPAQESLETYETRVEDGDMKIGTDSQSGTST
jgi:3-phenylpropionate/trans-cinnamate dioxygenase ferredoxin component